MGDRSSWRLGRLLQGRLERLLVVGAIDDLIGTVEGGVGLGPRVDIVDFGVAVGRHDGRRGRAFV